MMILFLFITGLFIGSFLNVLIDRLPKGGQVVKGRSYCDHCHKKLGFLDLIPLLSFIFLKGKCRYCHRKLSFYYPLVEFITGILFILVFQFYPIPSYLFILSSLHLVFIVKCLMLIVICCLIVIFFADLKYYIIPDEMIIIGIIASIFHIIISSSLHILCISLFHCFIVSLLSGLIVSCFFLMLFLITKGKGMGLGDVKLAFLMGLFLGWPKIVLSIYIAFLTGAFVGVILILGGKKKFGQTIPFGPFLVLGTIISLFLGEMIYKNWLNWF